MITVEERIKQRIKQLKKTTGLTKCFADARIEELEEVLQILADYNIEERNELVESTAEAFSRITDEMNRQLKFHGIFRSDTSIIIDAKQNKFVAVETEKWRELLDIVKNRLDFKKLTDNNLRVYVEGMFEKIEEKLKEIEK